MKLRVSKKSYGHIIEKQTLDGWRRALDGKYTTRGKATEKMRRMRDKMNSEFRADVGFQIIRSMPFCANVQF